jgi:hypothetical protein
MRGKHDFRSKASGYEALILRCVADAVGIASKDGQDYLGRVHSVLRGPLRSRLSMREVGRVPGSHHPFFPLFVVSSESSPTKVSKSFASEKSR